MRKAIFLVLLLGGCTSPAPPDVTLTAAQQVYSLKGQYKAVLEPIAAYEAQPRCTETIVVSCSDPELVAKIRETLPGIQAALDSAEAAVRANPGQPVPSTTISVIRAGLAQLNGYLVESAK